MLIIIKNMYCHELSGIKLPPNNNLVLIVLFQVFNCFCAVIIYAYVYTSFVLRTLELQEDHFCVCIIMMILIIHICSSYFSGTVIEIFALI